MKQEDILSSFEKELRKLERREAELERQITAYEGSGLKRYEDTYAFNGDDLIHLTKVCPDNELLIDYTYINKCDCGRSSYGLKNIHSPYLRFITKEDYEERLKALLCEIKSRL